MKMEKKTAEFSMENSLLQFPVSLRWLLFSAFTVKTYCLGHSALKCKRSQLSWVHFKCDRVARWTLFLDFIGYIEGFIELLVCFVINRQFMVFNLALFIRVTIFL